jgi:hypothetical protein
VVEHNGEGSNVDEQRPLGDKQPAEPTASKTPDAQTPAQPPQAESTPDVLPSKTDGLSSADISSLAGDFFGDTSARQKPIAGLSFLNDDKFAPAITDSDKLPSETVAPVEITPEEKIGAEDKKEPPVAADAPKEDDKKGKKAKKKGKEKEKKAATKTPKTDIEKKRDRERLIEWGGLALVLVVLLAIAFFGLILYATAVYLFILTSVGYTLWKGRATNPIYVNLLGFALAAVITAIYCMWLELAAYDFSIRARESRPRLGVNAPVPSGMVHEVPLLQPQTPGDQSGPANTTATA